MALQQLLEENTPTEVGEVTKRQFWCMFTVAILVQCTLGFHFIGCMTGLAIGAVTAWAMRDVLNASYRLRRIGK